MDLVRTINNCLLQYYPYTYQHNYSFIRKCARSNYRNYDCNDDN